MGRRAGRNSDVRRIELLAFGKHGPQDARVLVGYSDQRLVIAQARLQLDDPARESVAMPMSVEHGRSRALEQQSAQIVAALFGNAPEPLLAAATLLLWNGTKPGSHLTAVPELSGIDDG